MGNPGTIQASPSFFFERHVLFRHLGDDLVLAGHPCLETRDLLLQLFLTARRYDGTKTPYALQPIAPFAMCRTGSAGFLPRCIPPRLAFSPLRAGVTALLSALRCDDGVSLLMTAPFFMCVYYLQDCHLPAEPEHRVLGGAKEYALDSGECQAWSVDNLRTAEVDHVKSASTRNAIRITHRPLGLCRKRLLVAGSCEVC